MNAIPKLISKLLANRLRIHLPELISSNQTAFVQGRQITENFNSTREMLHHISTSGKPACFIKIDFAKAFDSVNWDYLQRVMEGRGFPQRWIRWIETLLTTASSRIGLRQGDPLSPMLFDIAFDVLSKMIEVLNGSVQSRLTKKLKQAVVIHQYADDTVFIANAEPITIITLKVPVITSVLGCSLSDFPTIYLGLPLTLKKPNRELFMPLIEKIESKLEGWKTRFISRGAQGSSISYWFDAWTYPTMISQFIPSPSTRKYSLQMAITTGICQLQLVQEHAEDRVLWLWTKDNEYTVNSFYKLVISAGKPMWRYKFIWRLKIPPTVHCNKARTCWARINALLGVNIVQPGYTVPATVENSWRGCKNQMSRNRWGSYFFAICWYLWRARNKMIFEGCETDAVWIAHHASREVKMWMKFC
ncbi:uncharacterized protein LOC144568089 [Carex rostrata]